MFIQHYSKDEDLLDDNGVSAVKNVLVSLQGVIQRDKRAVKQGIKMLDPTPVI